MALNPRVRHQVVQKLEAYEGRVSHFYLDSVGKVTVGVGHLVANPGELVHFSMKRVAGPQAGAPATLEEKREEYDRVVSEPVGYRAEWYRRITQLMMDDAEITRLRDRHVDQFYAELKRIYTRSRGYKEDFDRFPPSVQMALFDLIFNLGATRLVTVFRRLDTAIRASDWKCAAMESHRPQVGSARNHYVRHLFLTAAGVSPTCTPAC